jgi:hypothetical protein
MNPVPAISATAGKSLMTSLPTAPVSQGAPADSGDLTTLRRYLLGGLGIGAAAGGVTSLINHFNRLNDKAKAKEDTSGDDDVLYINLRHPGQKQAASELAHMLGMAGGALAGLGGYNGVRKLYQEFKRKQLQKELDAAQNTYLDTLVSEKSAANLGDMAFRAPGALALLIAASSGALTDKILTKNFPSPKAPSGLKPRRLVLRESPDTPEEVEKVASEDFDDAAEGLLRLVLEFPGVERSELPDLVKAAAAGAVDGLLAAADRGAEEMVAFAKQAKTTDSKQAKELALGWLVREPELAEAVKLAAALEFADACPLAMSLARGADEDTQADLIKLAAEFCRATRAAIWSNPPLPETTKEALDLTDALRLGLDAGKPEENLVSGASEDSSDSVSKPTVVEAQGSKAKALLAKNQDVIDEIMQPNSTNKLKAPNASPAAVAPAL